MRLGVLGGTFDPVHRGHLALADAARAQLGLDRVLFVPAGRPWRKAGQPVSPVEHRLEMLRAALKGEPAYEIATLEIERPGPSYTADTLEALQAEEPGNELFFIMGEDALLDLPEWVRPQRILELAKLAVARRADLEPQAVEEVGGQLPMLLERVVWLKMPRVAVSATEIRERVRVCAAINEMVPPAVEAYIHEHSLYRT